MGSRVPEEANIYSNEAIRSSYTEGLNKLFMTAWGKLYRTNRVKEILLLSGIPVGENICFNLQYLKCAQFVKTISYPGYGYRVYSNSTTNSIQRFYSPYYEHDYRLIQNSIIQAKSDFGYQYRQIETEMADASAHRCYLELTNLVRPGCNKSKSEIFESIRLLFEDKLFVQSDKRKKF